MRLGTVINAPDRKAALGKAQASARAFGQHNLASETDMLQIQYALNSAGFNADLARTGSETIAKLAAITGGDFERTGPTDGFWRDADWLLCRDGRWRPVEPGTFPLADRAAARVGRLRAYGNALVPQLAAEVVAAFMDGRARTAETETNLARSGTSVLRSEISVPRSETRLRIS